MSDVFLIRQGHAGDVAALSEIATAAYEMYILRIGRKPAPMMADFGEHARRGEVYVLEADEEITAFIVTFPRDGGQFIENVAVRPDSQGHGYGRVLLNHGEVLARQNDLDRMVLYTNVKMTENLAFYPRLGYVETKRISESGFERVYYEKRLTHES